MMITGPVVVSQDEGQMKSFSIQFNCSLLHNINHSIIITLIRDLNHSIVLREGASDKSQKKVNFGWKIHFL